MNSRWCGLVVLGLVSVLAFATLAPTQLVDPAKGDGETRTIKGELTGKELRDRVRTNAPAATFDHTLVKGKTYLLDLKSADFDPYLRVENLKGAQVAADDDSGGDLNAQISYTAEEDGKHNIIVTGFGAGSRGKFTLTIRPVTIREAKIAEVKLQAEGATTVKNKVTVADGTDRFARHYRTYAFAAKKSQLYRIDVADLAGARLQLLDKTGRLLRETNGGKGAALTFRPRDDGDYRIQVVSGGAGQTGDFTLTITPSAPRTAQITDIDPTKAVKLTSALGAEDATDAEGRFFRAFRWKAEVGKLYIFEARGKARPILWIEADGKKLRSEDYGDVAYSHLSFEAPKTGEYSLIVAANQADHTGEFTLTGGDRLALAVPMTLTKEQLKLGGALVQDDELDNQGRHRKSYLFKAEQGKIYRFVATGEGFAATLGIERISTGKGTFPVSFVPPGPGSPPGRQVFVPPQTDSYFLTVAAPPGRTGKFTLTSEVLLPRLAKLTDPKYRDLPVRVGTLSGTITREDAVNANKQPYHVVALKTAPKKQYEVKLTVLPGSSMPTLRLEGAKGELLQTGLSTVGNTLALGYPSMSADDLRLVITGAVLQTTSYTLSITESEYTPPKLVTLQFKETIHKVATITGTISEEDGLTVSGQPYHLLALKTEPKKLYDLKLVVSPKDSMPTMRLEGLKGEIIRSGVFGPNNTQTLPHPSTKSEELRVAITGFLNRQTPYTLTITETDYIAPKLTGEKLVVTATKPAVVMSQLLLTDPQGAINKAHKAYTFEAPANKTYQIDLHSTAFDAYLYLQNSLGTTLAQNDDNGESLDSRIVYTTTAAGTYRILATSLGGNGTGEFTLTVREIGGGGGLPKK